MPASALLETPAELGVRKPFGPSPETGGDPNGLRLQARARGRQPADPPTFRTAVPNWRPGDTIPLGRGKALRVVAVRDTDADQPPHVGR